MNFLTGTGAISGTPNQEGAFNFTVRVRDDDETALGVSLQVSIRIHRSRS